MVSRPRLQDTQDPVLISELSAPSYKFTSSGKILVERKDEMKARGLKSPNAADALAMTFQGGDQSARHIGKLHEIDDGPRSLDAYSTHARWRGRAGIGAGPAMLRPGTKASRPTPSTKERLMTFFFWRDRREEDVRYWHKADIPSCTAHVRFWG